jgi:hypothetical protein
MMTGLKMMQGWIMIFKVSWMKWVNRPKVEGRALALRPRGQKT